MSKFLLFTNVQMNFAVSHWQMGDPTFVVFIALKQQLGDMDCGKIVKQKQMFFKWLRIFLVCVNF